jgi:hypothetical protein
MPEVTINASAEQNLHPVRVLPSDGPLSQPSPGMALCLSGGGYRAMLFHLGTLWRLNGMRTNIADYHLTTAMNCPFEQALALANTATRLKRLDSVLQERIINWGYAVCDAAIRAHVNPIAALPTDFPYPSVGVGQRANGSYARDMYPQTF